MANVLSRAISWLVEFVREVDRGIAVGYGYEPPEKRRGRRFATTARAIVFRAAGAKAFGVVVFAVFRYAP